MSYRSRTLTLSVVVPVYNEEQSIEQCVSALHEQSDAIHEIIIVDNNCTDKTVAIIQKFHYPKVRIVKERTPGLVYARNTGMRKASGDIVARVDADSIVQAGWANAITRFFDDPKNSNVDAVTGNVTCYDLPWPSFVEKIHAAVVFSGSVFSGGRQLYGSNQAIRRTIWDRISRTASQGSNFMEDLDMSIHIRQAGSAIGYEPAMKTLTSPRRIASTPLHYWKYNAMWPRTYWINHKYLQAVAICVPMIVVNIGQLIVYPLLKMYEPEQKQFTLRRLWYGSAFQERRLP